MCGVGSKECRQTAFQGLSLSHLTPLLLLLIILIIQRSLSLSSSLVSLFLSPLFIGESQRDSSKDAKPTVVFSISKCSCPAHCLLTWEKRICSSTTVSGQHTQDADASEANSYRIIWANLDKTEISNKAIIHEETYCNQSKHIFYVYVEPNELATTNGLINGVNIIGFLLANKRV